MAKLTNSRNLYNLTKMQILDKITDSNSGIDEVLLDMIVSDFICFKIFAEFDANLNAIIKNFKSLHNIEPNKKEIGYLKPAEIKKHLHKNFNISKSDLSFLDNRVEFTEFIINRHSIGHTASASSISFSQAKKYLDEGDDILEQVREILKLHGKIPKLYKSHNFFQNLVDRIMNKLKKR